MILRYSLTIMSTQKKKHDSGKGYKVIYIRLRISVIYSILLPYLPIPLPSSTIKREDRYEVVMIERPTYTFIAPVTYEYICVVRTHASEENRFPVTRRWGMLKLRLITYFDLAAKLLRWSVGSQNLTLMAIEIRMVTDYCRFFRSDHFRGFRSQPSELLLK